MVPALRPMGMSATCPALAAVSRDEPFGGLIRLVLNRRRESPGRRSCRITRIRFGSRTAMEGWLASAEGEVVQDLQKLRRVGPEVFIRICAALNFEAATMFIAA